MKARRRQLCRSAAPLLFALLCASPLHAAPTVVLAAGERPPYLGPDLPQGGYAAELATAAFQREGYRVRLEFYTWARARLQAEQGKADGLLTSEATAAGLADPAFVYTRRFPGGTTGLLKKKSLALSYPAEQLRRPALLFKSLAPYRIGAVRDGVSLPAFEAASFLHKEIVAEDLNNLDMLDQDRVQLALVDKFSAADLMVGQRPRLIGQLEFMTPPLAHSDFYLAFSKRVGNHQQLRDAFNAGLAELSRDGTL